MWLVYKKKEGLKVKEFEVVVHFLLFFFFERKCEEFDYSFSQTSLGNAWLAMTKL